MTHEAEMKMEEAMTAYEHAMNTPAFILDFTEQLYQEYQIWFLTTDSDDKSVSKFIEQRFSNVAF